MTDVNDLRSQISKAMGCTVEQYDLLPYLLQDLWALGSFPKMIVDFLRPLNLPQGTNVLDLGCGKGMTSVLLASHLGFNVTGIDGIPAFVEYAKQKAKEYKVEKLTNFMYGDIKDIINQTEKYDMIILSSVGPVWGDWKITFSNLSSMLSQNGFVIVDEGYSDEQNEPYLTYENITNQFIDAGFKIVKELEIPVENLIKDNAINNEFISKRAKELIEQYPEKNKLIESYVSDQLVESNYLNENFHCMTWLLERKS